nr:uncharacterized protein LOC118681362 [Bactrocera oleae]
MDGGLPTSSAASSKPSQGNNASATANTSHWLPAAPPQPPEPPLEHHQNPARSKCAPMKTLTVPWLELQAAVLGTRLMQCIRDEPPLDITDCILWSNSKTVIKWIRSEHRRYKPFVQHRIVEILATTNVSNWRWLPTKLNVADESTRINDCINFSPVTRWSRGPPFLQQDEHVWPSEDIIVVENDEPDEELQSKFALVIIGKSCCLALTLYQRLSPPRTARPMLWFNR